MTDCPHGPFHAHVDTARVTEVDGQPALHFLAAVTVRCARCGRPFRFKGLPEGISVEQPTVDATGCEARLPMVPCDLDTSIC